MDEGPSSSDTVSGSESSSLAGGAGWSEAGGGGGGGGDAETRPLEGRCGGTGSDFRSPEAFLCSIGGGGEAGGGRNGGGGLTLLTLELAPLAKDVEKHDRQT